MTSKDAALTLCDIIQHELSLPGGRVVLYNQNYRAPNDSGLYVVVGLSSIQIISSNRAYVQDPTTEGMKAKQPMNVAGTFYIDFTSKGDSALERQGEIIASINSFYSAQKQESLHIRISRTPQVLDLSFIEGPSSLHRFRFEVVVFYLLSVEKPIDIYETIQTPEVVI